MGLHGGPHRPPGEGPGHRFRNRPFLRDEPRRARPGTGPLKRSLRTKKQPRSDSLSGCPAKRSEQPRPEPKTMARISEFASATLDPPVRGFLHLPDTANGDALVLTHGAGGNAQAPLLRALAETFANAGFVVLRCSLPYRQVRSFGPPGPGDAARDRAGLKNAIAAVREIAGGSGDTSRGAPLLASFARNGNPGTRNQILFFAITTAPIIATSNSREAISKANM